jgi:hypothetical protein
MSKTFLLFSSADFSAKTNLASSKEVTSATFICFTGVSSESEVACAFINKFNEMMNMIKSFIIFPEFKL